MAVKEPGKLIESPIELLATEYFIFVEVDGRQFNVTCKPAKGSTHNRILTPFSSEEERHIFIRFAKEFFGLMSQSSPLEKTVQEPSGIRRLIEYLTWLPLSLARRLYRSFWRERHGQDLSADQHGKFAYQHYSHLEVCQ